MDDVYRDQVKDWIGKRLGVSTDSLHLETDLAGDLGVDGGVAADLVEAFARHFGVDLANFRFERHFEEEEHDPTQALHSLMGRPRRPGKVPLTVGDLVHAAQRRVWPAEGVDR